MLNELYSVEGIDFSALFFRYNANINLEVSDYELKHALELDVVQEQHYTVVDTMENERDGYRIEYVSNGSKTYDRIVQTDSEATVPVWKQKKDLKTKILVRLKWNRSDIYAFKDAMVTAISIKEKRFLNTQIMEAKRSIKKYEGLLNKLSIV